MVEEKEIEVMEFLRMISESLMRIEMHLKMISDEMFSVNKRLIGMDYKIG